MSIPVEPTADRKEYATWDKGINDTLIGLGCTVAVALVASGGLIFMNWSEVQAFAPFGLGIAFIGGAIVLICTAMLKLGERRGAAAHLTTQQQLTGLAHEIAELRKEVEQVATATAQFIAEVHSVTRAGTDDVLQHRRSRG